jgi:flagellar protein FlaJ
MFRIGIVLALFSGLMAGQLSANSILAGFKHAILLLLGAIILFDYIIPYQIELSTEAAKAALEGTV